MEHFGHSLIYFGHRLYILDGRLYVLDVRMKVLKGDFHETYEIFTAASSNCSPCFISTFTTYYSRVDVHKETSFVFFRSELHDCSKKQQVVITITIAHHYHQKTIGQVLHIVKQKVRNCMKWCEKL